MRNYTSIFFSHFVLKVKDLFIRYYRTTYQSVTFHLIIRFPLSVTSIISTTETDSKSLKWKLWCIAYSVPVYTSSTFAQWRKEILLPAIAVITKSTFAFYAPMPPLVFTVVQNILMLRHLIFNSSASLGVIE